MGPATFRDLFLGEGWEKRLGENNRTSFFSCFLIVRRVPKPALHGASRRRVSVPRVRAGCWPQGEALGTLTDAAGCADADDGDVGAAGVVQQLDELVQHDGGGRDADTVLEPGRDAMLHQGRGASWPVQLAVREDRLPNVTLGHAKACTQVTWW